MILKLTFLLGSLSAFFWVFVFGPFYDRVYIQITLLLLLIMLNTWRTSRRDTWGLIKFCIPFVLTLLGFGLLFQFTNFMGREDWLRDSLIKAAVFPNSLIGLKFALSYITYLDLLRLPVSMDRRMDLITFKAAFQKGGGIMRRFKFYLDTYAILFNDGEKKKGFWTPVERRIKKYAAFIVALYLYLYEDIDMSRRVMENRLGCIGKMRLGESK